MRNVLVLAGLLASASAQAVTSLIVPTATPLPGCLNSAQGTFGLGIQNATGFPEVAPPPPARRSVQKRQTGPGSPEGAGGPLTMTLVGGVLRDQRNRTGYIASNYQFQFDSPPQAGAIYTAGWSVCDNGSIALGGQAIFYECPSGEFYNLYDRHWAPYCIAINFIANGVGDTYSTAAPAALSTGIGQNSITNGGATATVPANGTAPAATSAPASTASVASGASSSVSSVRSSASSAASSVASSASSRTSAAASSASSATSAAASTFTGAAQATAVPQQVLAWAAGIVGAIALV